MRIRRKIENHVGTSPAGPTLPAPGNGAALTRAEPGSAFDPFRREAAAPGSGTVSLSSGVSAFILRERRELLLRLRGRGSTPRVFAEFSWLVPRLLNEWDDFRPWKTRLYWWSFGAFASKGQLEGNQYLAGRRAPPLLHA